MEAFYVSIIFLGVLLVIVALIFIAIDRVNGKDFFKEFDRKKDEMFNLIQDSEEMVQELNRMSDYVVTVIAEKNQEFFNKSASLDMQESLIKQEATSSHESKEFIAQVQEELIYTGAENTNQSGISEDTVSQNNEPDVQKLINTQFSYNKDTYNKDSQNIGKSKLALNSRRSEVLQMIEQGLSNDEISDKLKIGKGEIGLIRGLTR